MTLPIVYLYPDARWGTHAGRQQLLPEALSRHVPVVFLSTARPTRGLLELRLPHAEQVEPRVVVVHDALALRTNRWWRRVPWVSHRIDGLLLRRVLRRLGVDQYVYWLSAPEPRWLEGVRRDRLVYDCIDPAFDGDRDEHHDREVKVAREAKVVFCTSRTLLERMERIHEHVHLLNNAAAPELYAGERAGVGEVPGPLRDRPKPIVGHVGTIDWRIDCETLTHVARSLPDYTFCLAGRVNADQEHRVRQLRSLPNVVMPGEVAPEVGAAYNEAFDVGLVPYLTGEVGDALNPVKMYMYLLAGKPVVTTWTRECVLAQPYVRATQTPSEFAAAVQDAVEHPDQRTRAERIAFAERNTWDHRARAALAVLRQEGLLPDERAAGA